MSPGELSQKVGSPIELKFALAYIELLHSRGHPTTRDVEIWESFDGSTSRFKSPRLEQFDALIPQAEIERFRVDFLLLRYCAMGTEDGLFILERLPMLIVECDGEDFHHRTPDQASRDNARSRILMHRGYRITRFTGADITRNASGCAAEIDRLFDGLLINSVKQ